MRSIRILRMLILAGTTAIFSVNSYSDEVGGGTIKDPVKGKVHTGYVSVLAASQATLSAAVPAGQVFLVTQLCAYTDGTATAEMRFYVSATKNIAGLLVGQATQCVSFSPGVLLAAGDGITCANSGSANGTSHCQVTVIF